MDAPNGGLEGESYRLVIVDSHSFEEVLDPDPH
jgi:hypothetical protein